MLYQFKFLIFIFINVLCDDIKQTKDNNNTKSFFISFGIGCLIKIIIEFNKNKNLPNNNHNIEINNIFLKLNEIKQELSNRKQDKIENEKEEEKEINNKNQRKSIKNKIKNMKKEEEKNEIENIIIEKNKNIENEINSNLNNEILELKEIISKIKEETIKNQKTNETILRTIENCQQDIESSLNKK